MKEINNRTYIKNPHSPHSLTEALSIQGILCFTMFVLLNQICNVKDFKEKTFS